MLQLLAQDRVANAATEPSQQLEGDVKTIASQQLLPTLDAVQSIRAGLRDVASETALHIQHLSQATVKQAIAIGQRLWRMQRDLKRKEYKIFLSILGWATAKARKFINLAKTFDGFEPSQLSRVELTTLLNLCSSRYSLVVDQLRSAQNITQQLVEQLIKENRPARKPKQDPISGWKQNRFGGTRRYEVILHDEDTGVSIEQQAKAEGILPSRVIAEAIALLAKHKEATLETQVTELIANTSNETGDVQEHERSHTEQVEELAPTEIALFENQLSLDDAYAISFPCESVDDQVATQEHSVDQHLEQQATAIAVPPEAILAGENRTEVEWVLNAPIDEVKAVVSSVPVRSAYRALYLLNRFESSDAQRMELLEQRVTEYHIAIGVVLPTAASPSGKPPWGIATEQVTKYSSQEAEVTDSFETEQESSRSERASEDNDLPEKEARMWKTRASELGLVLDYTTTGEYTVRHNYRKLGTVVQQWDSNNNSWWENRRQISLLGVDDGDRMRYKTPEEAAIALGKLCEVIDEGSSASAELFGRWESEPSHLVEEHTDFIDDVEQEVQSLQAVGGEGEAP